MKELRLKWEPINRTPLNEIEKHFLQFMGKRENGVTIFSNGSLLFTPIDRNDLDDARKAMAEAKFMIDFTVMPMKDGSYLVRFHRALAVFVGADEFQYMRDIIASRIDELKFPEEVFFQEKNESHHHLLIGLYARGKLQYDSHHFSIYKRVDKFGARVVGTLDANG